MKVLTPKWKKLAAHFLRDAADYASNRSCNDWDFPENWTPKEQREFVHAFEIYNGTPEEYDPNHLHIPDCSAMDFLAALLELEAEDET